MDWGSSKVLGVGKNKKMNELGGVRPNHEGSNGFSKSTACNTSIENFMSTL